MRTASRCLFIVRAIIVLCAISALAFTACAPQRPTLATAQQSQIPAATPMQDETQNHFDHHAADGSGALQVRTLPLPIDAPPAEDPLELGLFGGLIWMWENPLNSPRTLTCMYSMCAAVIGKDDTGRDCIYAGQVYGFGESVLYTASDDYPRIGSLAGTKFAVYFVEHNQTHWRLKYLPLDSSPEQAEIIDEGKGLIPVLGNGELSMMYAAEENGTYEIRVWEMKLEESQQTKLLGKIVLPGKPLEPERRYMYYGGSGVTYTQEAESGYNIVSCDFDGINEIVHMEKMPLHAQFTAWGLFWMDSANNLYAYSKDEDTHWMIASDVNWFNIHPDGISCIFAKDDATRVIYASPFHSDKDGDVSGYGTIVLAQGSWKYVDGLLYSPGEDYACVLRERDGSAQFVGMELTLLPGG